MKSRLWGLDRPWCRCEPIGSVIWITVIPSLTGWRFKSADGLLSMAWFWSVVRRRTESWPCSARLSTKVEKCVCVTIGAGL
jgi:hypothetical protein